MLDVVFHFFEIVAVLVMICLPVLIPLFLGLLIGIGVYIFLWFMGFWDGSDRWG